MHRISELARCVASLCIVLLCFASLARASYLNWPNSAMGNALFGSMEASQIPQSCDITRRVIRHRKKLPSLPGGGSRVQTPDLFHLLYSPFQITSSTSTHTESSRLEEVEEPCFPPYVRFLWHFPTDQRQAKPEGRSNATVVMLNSCKSLGAFYFHM